MIEKTINQLGVVIKECKQVETQAEENEKEQHDTQLRINQQHSIYDNGSPLPNIYRKRILDLHH
ncbi:hypothetical protein P5673_022415 [Acropora cervicornis]|uniref:Uncharacterized protein n=1 Tax=Acropora cervicornis TaxID=6130 RepID=A0AAD9Q7L0_ACRCE|nr:hypothetical protein P5673_022415 [Acropora cervicornis]